MCPAPGGGSVACPGEMGRDGGSGRTAREAVAAAGAGPRPGVARPAQGVAAAAGLL